MLSWVIIVKITERSKYFVDLNKQQCPVTKITESMSSCPDKN